ncbi:acyl-CoA thioesterase [Calothrix rhizosoleniae]|uniref:acyl-CoA thioesterase n=1 Tax=Calothrix rhizosoleniae TaxID=888997 RepID=UPI000B49C8C1|nr:thioesterase family protein [Calothrix rhizosoleniae]
MSFTYHRTVRFGDTDAAGVVYFANALAICHEAYEESLETVGINLQDFFGNSSLAFPIVHSSIDFFRPMFCGNKLIVSLIPQKLTVEKFEINYEILIGDVIVSKAVTRHVCIDTNTRQKNKLPSQMVQWLDTNRKNAENTERRKSREFI